MARPSNVGILALEVYIPKNQVDAAELEVQDGVPGKYTKGLEQVALSFCFDCEDTVSLALTCLHNLLEKYNIEPKRIGRLEVGSESSPDRSKSIKSHLTRLLADAGNHDLEGVDCVHGCYGATSALFNSVNWVESSSWDGRFAVVVASDVSHYAPHTASRATGGAGAVAMLIGPNAPLVVDPAWRASYTEHSNEFCKPPGCGPFPVFDGPSTLRHYLLALDGAYVTLYKRLLKLYTRVLELKAQGQLPSADAVPFNVSQGILPLVDYVVCHSPYARLVRKAFARMALHDAVRAPQGDIQLRAAGVPARWRVCEPDALQGEGYGDKALEAALLQGTRQAYDIKVLPGAWAQQHTGNAYTASLYIGLAGLWERQGALLEGRRVLLFAFGSGTMSSFFSLVGRAVTPDTGFSLAAVASKIQLGLSLHQRSRQRPEVYDAVLQQVKDYYGKAPIIPHTASISWLPMGVWFLEHVDEKHVRHYTRKVLSSSKPGSHQTSSSAGGSASIGMTAGTAGTTNTTATNFA